MSDARSTYRFARLPEWVLLHPDLSHTDVCVYAVLDRFDGRECIPSLARIAERLRCSEDTVRRSIRRLQVIGAVAVESRVSEGRQTSNRYHLAGDAPLDRAAPTRGRPCTDATPDPGTGARGEGGTGATRSRAMKDPEQEDPENTPAHRADERVSFEAFWELYPRRVAKRAAQTAWKSALKRADVDAVLTPGELILAGLRRRVGWWAQSRTPADKIAHPATWLNRDGWFDEIEPAPVAKAATVAQAAADHNARVLDEVERAIDAGDADLAWRLIRDRAFVKGEGWFDAIAGELERGTRREWILRQVTKEVGGRVVPVTDADVDMVAAARAELNTRCGLSPVGAQSTLALKGPS
jgi:biotin operon repressor